MPVGGKLTPVAPDSLLNINDITAYYRTNPFPLGPIDAYFPLDESESNKWETITNQDFEKNEAADPITSDAPIPVAGREGYKTIMGGMAEMGKGREMTSKELKKFEKLKANFAKVQNTENAQKLVDFYGNDLSFVRNAINAQRIYLCWALLSNACSISFSATNSKYFQGINAMEYPIESWQKNDVGTSWADATSLILDDIQSVVDAAEAEGRFYAEIKINKKWFGYVRKNTQVKTQTITLFASLTGAETNPTLVDINSMLVNYFQFDIKFVVVDAKITRGALDGTKVTSNPFADGVAVFTIGAQVGRFEWYPEFILDPTKEASESYFVVGTKSSTDPNYLKTYSKAEGFPTIDSFADNYYLKINAVAW